MLKKSIYFISIIAVFMLFSSYARAEVDGEVQYILNTFLFLVSGFLVMWMAAGFAMLESGLVTSKSVATIAAKNIGLYSIAGLMFWLVGYNMAYGIPAGGFIGSPLPWSDGSALDTGYSDGSDWFFQMVFCATTCSIVSGTLAERIKIWPFFIFCALLTGFIYPIEMGWQWGGGYLAEAGFSDFAGSTLVHSAGAAAALAGAILLGPRLGRFTDSGEAAPMEPFANSSIPLATLGVFILWLGWFGFNGGSQLAMGTFDDVTAVATIAAKNIGLYSIAGLMFWLVGYNMAYGIPAGGFIGSPLPWSDGSALDTGYSDGSDWFFQMVFCATTCSIVSGTLAERIKIWPFFIFCALLTGFILSLIHI